MLGPKIDARLNLLERKLADMTHRLERLEKPPEMISLPVVTLPLVSPNDTLIAPVSENAGVDATPKRRGRPPKAKNG